MWPEIAAVSVLPVLVLCFSQQDNELFRLRDKVAEDLGQDTTFYSWLGLKKGAGVKEVTRAYRKLSRTLHPDRNPGVAATERFARLNQVYKTLTSPLRERYDYYLSAGFPLYSADSDSWAYKRYRPNVFVVLFVISLIYTGLQFIVLKISASRQRTFVKNLVEDIYEAAKSPNSGLITRPTRVEQAKNVYTVHPNGDVFFEGSKLTPELVQEPTWCDTHAGKLVKLARSKINGAPQPAATGSAASEKAESANVDSAAAAAAQTAAAEASQAGEPSTLKKGAARRRPAAARGKAKIF